MLCCVLFLFLFRHSERIWSVSVLMFDDVLPSTLLNVTRFEVL